MAKTKRVIDQTAPTGDANSDTPWVSPDVAAAQSGKRVEMGQTIEDKEEIG